MANAPGMSIDDMIYYRDAFKVPTDDPLSDDCRKYTAHLARVGASLQSDFGHAVNRMEGWLNHFGLKIGSRPKRSDTGPKVCAWWSRASFLWLIRG
ncbi:MULTISPECIES: hypothetical protein [Thalassospira]|jgi:acetyl esterase|uniref:hypothetical protein n=1 Tax=Thalassospira TaxID=168934 RepID=UPI001FFC7F07|nr:MULTISPECIES: hypothetical protein [Thalassospira]MDM7977876.1 hypothetical protein [Thalassospira xiamenensis]|tara:strand:+ start:241 stop:528 length:288 start_codon:yes stop_codon:yes gene_type:complete